MSKNGPSAIQQSAAVANITLADLPALAATLVAQVRRSAFEPDLVLYVERGARLLAFEVCELLGTPALSVKAQRSGLGLKSLVAPLARLLPAALNDTLRRVELRFQVGGAVGSRDLESPFSGTLAGNSVLIVDDACDSGRTVESCRGWLHERMVEPDDIRVAVIAATTPDGRRACDHWLLEQPSRFPWSFDSHEYSTAERQRETSVPRPYSLGDL